MRVTWEVDDGYVSGRRPQYTTIPDEELDGLTEDEIDALIDEYVQCDFEALTWYITHIAR